MILFSKIKERRFSLVLIFAITLLFSSVHLFAQDELGDELDELNFDDTALEEDDSEKASYLVSLNLQDEFRYFKTRDESIFSVGAPFEFKNIQNYGILNTYIEALSGNKSFGFVFKNRFYQNTSHAQIDGSRADNTVHLGIHNELEEFFFSGYLLNDPINLSVHIGKMIASSGVSYLFSVTDYLKKEGWSDNLIGSYQVRIDLIHEYFDLKLAYLPVVKSDFHEFSVDKLNQGSKIGLFYASIGNQYDTLHSKLSFFWNGEPHVGLNMDVGIGDEVLLYTEQSVHYKEFGKIKETGTSPALPFTTTAPPSSLPTYSYEKETLLQYSGVVGVSYTPEGLFTLLFEAYYAVDKGESWSDKKDKLAEVKDAHDQIDSLGVRSGSAQIRSLATSYRGVSGDMLSDFDVFENQPFFLMLRIFRDNFLKDFVSQQFDIATTLIYSPLDTSFIWRNEFAWVSDYAFKLGVRGDWSLGKAEGVLTSIPYEFIFRGYVDFNF